MVGRIAFRPLLRLLRGAGKGKKWADLRVLLKDHLLVRRMASNQQDPLPPILFQMATGYWVSQAIYVGAKLGIADLLANGPQSTEELAAATSCDRFSLFRVLRALASSGVLSQIEKDRFALAGLGKPLRSNVPGSLRRVVITLGEIHYQACAALLHSVRTGSPGFHQVFGTSLFEYLQRDSEARIAFNQGMTDLASLLAHAILLAYDFSDISTIVDVGGGEGELLRIILEAYPEMTGIVFDLPNELCSRGDGNSAQRLSHRPGDFFDSVPKHAEAYLLCGVVHDWSDERASVILSNCREAMPRNGRLLIIETVVPERNSASFSKLLDINMMVMTSGRERTISEFHTLLQGANFQVSRVIPTLAPHRIIEAIPH